MPSATAKFRFCPSPTGLIHFGNVRTALFNALLAHKMQGILLLRIEDTDKERSKDEYTQALMSDLRWLGLHWNEGAEAGGEQGPYWQSQRQAIYDGYYQQLTEGKTPRAYPCFCTEEQLEAVRKLQRTQGKPPRYPGTCRHLSAEEIASKIAQGLKPTLRFRIPDAEAVEFTDLAKGPQRFLTDDIGDFIVRRGDGTAPFMYCNAIDDACMGVTHVVRGEDHLTNTPRQILILKALNLPLPEYCHISLIMGADHTPLSKRNGSQNIQTLREQGYLPAAIVNYLARLGHYYGDDRFLSLKELAELFDFKNLNRSAAHFDQQQLLHWQKEAVMSLSLDELKIWTRTEMAVAKIPEDQLGLFLKTIQPNVLFPKDYNDWALIIYGSALDFEAETLSIFQKAGAQFFTTALEAVKEQGINYLHLQDRIKTGLGVNGKALFQPLRLALTGLMHGPHIEPLLQLMGPEKVQQRFSEILKLL